MTDRLTSMEVSFATLAATLGTKLDALIVAVGTNHADHEARVRALEVRPAPDATHEARLTILERANVETHEARLDALEKAHDATVVERLSALEKWRWIITGAAIAGGGTVGGAVATFLGGGGGP